MTIYVGDKPTNIYMGSSLISNAYYGEAAVGKVKNAFSVLKAKLDASENVVIFVNADSTGYSEYGPYYLWAKQLGDLYDATVTLYRWREYADTVKDYDAGTELRAGSGPNIVMYLAAFPGRVAGTMFEGTRKPTAIDAIPTPDVCIMHHGHNMNSYATVGTTASVGAAHFYSIGVSKWLGPLGMTEVQWPGVGQVVTTQNPWKDLSDGRKMYWAPYYLKQAQKGVTLVNSYDKFITAGMGSTLYRSGDNIHPSDSEANHTGAQLVADALMSSFNASIADNTYTLPAWPLRSATNLLDNGDFSSWSGALPTGWTLAGSGTAMEKDMVEVYGGASYSAKISPSTTIAGQTSYVQKYLSTQEMSRLAGKTVTIAVLVKSTNNVGNPGVYFSIPSTNGVIRDNVTFSLLDADDGWMWHIIPGITITPNAAETWRYLRLIPAQTVSTTPTADPMYVQRVMVFEGTNPAGIIA